MNEITLWSIVLGVCLFILTSLAIINTVRYYILLEEHKDLKVQTIRLIEDLSKHIEELETPEVCSKLQLIVRQIRYFPFMKFFTNTTCTHEETKTDR